MMRIPQSALLAGVIILLMAAVWKVIVVMSGWVPFNADEAVVALMARHILNGERPIFFYGQAYMGSLDAFLVAAGFGVLGQQVWVVRLVQGLLYLATLTTTILIGKELFGRWRDGLLAAAILAVPAVNGTLYTTASLGGYGEAILIGNGLLWGALRLVRNPGLAKMTFFGLLAGLGLWANALSAVYSLPCLVYLAWGLRKQTFRQLSILTAGLLIGGILGSLPWWIFAAQHGFGNLLLELTGSAVAVEHTSWISRLGLHLINLLLLGLPALFGLRPPWSVDWLALPLLPFTLMVWGAVMVFWFRRCIFAGPLRPGYLLIAGIPLTLAAGFLLSNFGADPSGRYFLPLSVPFALVVVQMCDGLVAIKRWRWSILLLLAVFQLWGNLQVALTLPTGYTTQFDKTTILDHSYDDELIAFLKSNGEIRGYASYWISYPIAFQSREEVILAARLPYHADLRYTVRDDRYSPYTQAAAESKRSVYISSRETIELLNSLRSGLTRLGVTWQEKQIGDYIVFYGLSRMVMPEELGFGVTRE